MGQYFKATVQSKNWADKMVMHVKVLATKSEDLSMICETKDHGRKKLTPRSCLTSTCVSVCLPKHIHTKKKSKKARIY